MSLVNTNIISKLWLFPYSLEFKPITKEEKEWSSFLPESRRNEFIFSRGYTRFALSSIFDIEPLSIPLYAKPGQPPELDKGFGFSSISHCEDALLVGWSNSRIGVDIESINRSFDVKRLSNYLLSYKEKLFIQDSHEDSITKKFLSIWVRKEALVKYARGNILRDFKNWKINESSNSATCIITSKSISVNYAKFHSWMIGVASNSNLSTIPEIKTFD